MHVTALMGQSMDDTTFETTEGSGPAPVPEAERIEVAGLGGSLSAAALRALLDPATREDATIEIDLGRLAVSIPAASLHAVLAQLMPQGSVEVGAAGLTVRPGGGSPGVRISVPERGVRVRIGADGLRVGTE